MRKNENELDDLVIKVLGHKERKRILKIVGSYPKGINYTGKVKPVYQQVN